MAAYMCTSRAGDSGAPRRLVAVAGGLARIWNVMADMTTTPKDTSLIGLLKDAGLRPTRQRVALGGLLFTGVDRHVSAEALHDEAQKSGYDVSLATVYNTLHQFTQAGLLRELAVDGAKTYFDTNTSNHNHFYVEAEGRLEDIDGSAIRVEGIPAPPDGMVIAHIDVVVRLARRP